MVDCTSDFGNAADIFKQFPQLLEDNNGVFLGELHGLRCASYLLEDTMQDLQKVGLKVLFLEHYFRKDQDVLDDYKKTGDRDPVYQRNLENYIEVNGPLPEDANMDLFKKHIDKTLDVVDEANKNGVKVMALDKFEYAKLGVSEERVSLKVNSDWARYVEEVIGDTDQKYMVLAGAEHSDSAKGVDALLGIPSVDSDCFDLLDISKDVLVPSEEVEGNLKSRGIDKTLSSDFVFR